VEILTVNSLSAWNTKIILNEIKRWAIKYGYWYHLTYFQLPYILFLSVSRNTQCKLGKRHGDSDCQFSQCKNHIKRWGKNIAITFTWCIFSYCLYFLYRSLESHSYNRIKRHIDSNCQFSRCMKYKNHF